MSTTHWTNSPSHCTQTTRHGSSHFSQAQWHELIQEDNAALSGISILLTAIISMGMLGMAIVVGILAFGS